jgi:hypothetical protein
MGSLVQAQPLCGYVQLSLRNLERIQLRHGKSPLSGEIFPFMKKIIDDAETSTDRLAKDI